MRPVRVAAIVVAVVLAAVVMSGCSGCLSRRARVDDLKPIKAQLERIEHKVNQCARRTG